MASHTGQKWSRFFYSSRDFLCKLTFLFQVEMFQFKLRCSYSSQDFFMSKFLFQVEKLFFHVEIISSRGFYLMLRVFSCRHFFFKRRIFVLLEVFQVDISQFMARSVTHEYLLAFPGNDISNKITWRLVF